MFQTDWDSIKDNPIQIFGLVDDSIVDGPGLRFGIFVQGCSHNCPGCHNPESQPTVGGNTYTLSQIREKVLANKLIGGVTFSGGEPFEQCEACAHLAKALKEDGYNLWAYTGYLAENLLAKSETDPATKVFLENIDVLVDGPFVETLQTYDLKWRGSSNQRLIDMPKTMRENQIVEWVEPSFDFAVPPSW